MIKVVYTYHTPSQYLPELLEKFAQSAQPKFDSTPNNIKIEMWQRKFTPANSQDLLEQGEISEIVLDIYYDSIADFIARNDFENNNPDWQAIWFHPTNRHTEVSVQILENFSPFAKNR